jgi:C4-dicarboxylate-binding protein DctP
LPKKSWDSLPSETRIILEGAMKDACTYASRVAQESDLAALNAIKATGKTQIIELTAAKNEKSRTVANKAHKNSGELVGRELVNNVHQVAGYRPPQP